MQDRNSTNGTWVDGGCLSRGNSQALVDGSRTRGLPDAHAGWVDCEPLSRRPRRTELNQRIRRIRDDLRKLELFEAAQDVIVANRERVEIRIGVRRLQLVS